ncbi:MAG: hypothetical protein MJZ46_06455 [Bacteroidales bacterium]|nr:hypothetical protein [Bacteroidales bacterium]
MPFQASGVGNRLSLSGDCVPGYPRRCLSDICGMMLAGTAKTMSGGHRN